MYRDRSLARAPSGKNRRAVRAAARAADDLPRRFRGGGHGVLLPRVTLVVASVGRMSSDDGTGGGRSALILRPSQTHAFGLQ